MPLKVAIVGRPNVGKSTLFNRLVGRKLALVDDQPGVTRDRREADANLGGLNLRIIDTGGLSAGKTALDARVTKQSERAVEDADIVLFLIDARTGLTPADRAIAHGLRKHQPKVLLAANKCESRAGEAGLYEAFELGFGEPIALSAEHGLGLSDLLVALKARQKKRGATEENADDESRPVTLAIIGRPNTGKSTLVNRLIGEERMLTGPEAGITRDAVTVPLKFGRKEYRLVDTAGLRRRARVTEKVERLAVADALRALRYADVAILVLDANEPFETQDLAIADLAEREGRAVIFAVNKWDLVEHGPVLRGKLRKRADELLPQLRGTPFITLSALTGAGVDRLMAAVDEIYRLWNAKLPTARVNKFLEAALEKNPPPAVRGRRIKLRYMTQIKPRPPTFVLFGNQLDALPNSYRRYLVNALRDAFKLPGVPIRLQMRQTENPFEGRRKRR